MTESTPAIVPAVTDDEIANLKERAEKKDASGRATGLHNYHVMAAPYIARIDFEKAEVARLREQNHESAAASNTRHQKAESALAKLQNLMAMAKDYYDPKKEGLGYSQMQVAYLAGLHERIASERTLREQAEREVERLEDLIVRRGEEPKDPDHEIESEARAILASRAEGEKR